LTGLRCAAAVSANDLELTASYGGELIESAVRIAFSNNHLTSGIAAL